MKGRNPNYPIEVTTSELHFLRHLLTRVKENWGHISVDSIIREELHSLSALLSKHELEQLIVKLDQCLYNVVPAIRNMRLYDMTLDQMETKGSGIDEKRKKLLVDLPHL